jgi:PAS domain S-box-containing protein
MAVVAPKRKQDYVAGHDFADPFGVAATLPSVLQTAAALIPADAYSVWLLDVPQQLWRVAAARGLSDDYARQSVPAPPEGIPAEPICTEDVDQPSPLHARREFYRREQIRSLMALPLSIRGERRGTLVFYFRQRHKFTPDEIAHASALASLASSALATAELYHEQSQAKERLQRRELEERTLLSSIPDYIARFDRELRYLYKSAHPEVAASMPSGGYIGKTFRELGFPPHLVELWEKPLRRAFETAQPGTVEYSLPAQDGTVRHYVALVTPEVGGDGSVESVMTLTRDVTEQRNASEKLRRSELELRLIIDSMPGLVAYVDREQVFRRVNRLFEQWFKAPVQSFIGKRVSEVVGENYAHLQAHIERALNGEIVQYETTNEYGDTTRRVLITYVPDFDAALQVCGFVALVMDVTERYQSEEALRKAEKLAAAGRLAASIAHEINNPLESVTNLLFLLQQEPALTDSGRQYLELAADELARVSQIATQTLRFHRQSTRPTLTSVEDIIDAVESLYQRRLLSSRVTLEKRYGGVDKINVLDGELRQLLANLIGNALDATPGGGRIVMRTRAVSNADGTRGVRITIADTGHGIAPELKKRIFEPFVTTKGTTGTGLGLWVSREIVEKHQGYMRVRSRNIGPGTGSVFSVYITELKE